MRSESCNVEVQVFGKYKSSIGLGENFSPLVRMEVSESVKSRSVRLSMWSSCFDLLGLRQANRLFVMLLMGFVL